MRIRDWYFQGWERRGTENGGSKLVYTGEYYALPASVARPRLLLSLYTALLIGAYGVAALAPSPGGMWRIAAIPQLLELIPLIYLVMGVVCLLCARQPMTFRGWYSSWRRVGRASLWSFLCCAAMAVVELVYLAAYGSLGEELSQLFCVLACAAGSFALWNIIRHNPCAQSAGEGKE